MPQSAFLRLLPVELIIICVGNTDISSVCAFSLVSRSCRDIVRNGSERIYAALAEGQFDCFLPSRTAGDTGVSLRAIPRKTKEDRLPEAIALQRTASRCFSNCRTWESFVRILHRTACTWDYGVPKRHTFHIGSRVGNSSTSIWRFKVCPEREMLLASTPSLPELDGGGLLCAASLYTTYSGSPYCPFVLSEGGFNHIEYTGGLLLFATRSETIQVWEWNEADAEGLPGAMVLRHEIKTASQVSSYKARYPYLLAESFEALKLYVFDIVLGQLVRSYAINPLYGRGYVEFDSEVLCQANDSILITDRETEVTVDILNPLLFPDLHAYAEEPGVNLASARWTGLHHSLDGRHLLAAGHGPDLLWFRDYRDQACSKAERFHRVVVLRFDSIADPMIVDNICVENNRVAFTARRSEYFSTLYFFELNEWEDHDDFVANPPIIRMLSGGLPTGIDGVSRLEMDSTSIYLTASSERPFSEKDDFEAVYEQDTLATWFTISGTALAIAEVLPVWPTDPSSSPKVEMRDFLAEHRILRNNCIRVYDFAGAP